MNERDSKGRFLPKSAGAPSKIVADVTKDATLEVQKQEQALERQAQAYVHGVSSLGDGALKKISDRANAMLPGQLLALHSSKMFGGGSPPPQTATEGRRRGTGDAKGLARRRAKNRVAAKQRKRNKAAR